MTAPTPQKNALAPVLAHDRSAAASEFANRYLVGGVNSPVRAFGSVGGEPVFVESAKGPYIFDVDGHRYIDLVGSWGPAIVGHARDEVLEVVRETMEKGISFGASCPLEAQLAEIIAEALPNVDLVRLVNSGTEAVMSAVRLARAKTGRSKIVKFDGCYHGHSDGLLVAAGSGAATFGVPNSAGVPREVASLTLVAEYNNPDDIARVMNEHGSDIACILVEPIAGNMGYVEPSPGFLEHLRTLCDQHGTLLLFDEVMTGFRVAWGGYQNLTSVKPDLCTLGKVIGGGMPVAAYAGPRDIMELVSPLGPAYQAGTLSGNPLGMACGIATLNLCREDGFYETLGERAAKLTAGLKTVAEDAGVSVQVGCTGGMFGLMFSDQPVTNYAEAQAENHDLFARFFHAMLERGVWLPPSGYEAMFISIQHDDAVLDEVISAAADSFKAIRS